MRDRSKSTPNVFSPAFLKRLAELPRSETITVAEAEHAGPWSVIRNAAHGFVITQDGTEAVKAVFRSHETAHLVAAILPGVGRPSAYRLACDTDLPGVEVQALTRGASEKIGWLREYSDEILEALHVAECLLRSPASLALFLQAACFESLVAAGGIVADRLPGTDLRSRE